MHPWASVGKLWGMKLQQPEPQPNTVNARLLNVKEAALYLALSPETLQSMRTRGDSPRYVKYGRGRTAPIRYDVRDLDAWIEAQKRRSTSDQGEAA